METWKTRQCLGEDLDNLHHLTPKHLPTLQNSNKTKQYNTYIAQSTIQSTKQSSKTKTYHNQRYKSKQAKTTIQHSLQTATKANNKLKTQADKAPPSSTTYLLQLTQQNPNNKIIQNPKPKRYEKPGGQLFWFSKLSNDKPDQTIPGKKVSTGVKTCCCFFCLFSIAEKADRGGY